MPNLHTLTILVFLFFSVVQLPINSLSSNYQNILFQVYRNQSKIGTHELLIDTKDSITEVNIKINFDVSFLGFKIYEYRHKNREKWIGNELILLDSSTDQNGKLMTCTLKKKGDKLDISGTDNTVLLDNLILPSSYWNSVLVKENKQLEILNTQDCSFINLNIEFVGKDKIYDGNLSAFRYKLKGFESTGAEVDIDIWYDKYDNWVKMRFLKDGSTIDYVLSNYDDE